MRRENENQQATMEKNFSGIVKEHATVSLGFRTAGQIERIYVKEAASRWPVPTTSPPK